MEENSGTFNCDLTTKIKAIVMSKTQDDRFGRTLLIRVPKTHNPSYRIAPFDSKVPHQVRNLPCPFLSLLSQDILI